MEDVLAEGPEGAWPGLEGRPRSGQFGACSALLMPLGADKERKLSYHNRDIIY